MGDSLTIGTVAFGSLRSRIEDLEIWTRVAIDARNGRKATAGSAIIADTLRAKKDVTALVIALGTNDMISNASPSYPRKLIDRVMASTKGRPVLWVNVEFSPLFRTDWVARAKRFNRDLRAATTRWPNLMVADWNSFFTPGKTVRFVADGVHLTNAAYRLRARWLARQLELFGERAINSTTTTSTTTTSTTTTSTTSTSTTSTVAPTTTVVAD